MNATGNTRRNATTLVLLLIAAALAIWNLLTATAADGRSLLAVVLVVICGVLIVTDVTPDEEDADHAAHR